MKKIKKERRQPNLENDFLIGFLLSARVSPYFSAYYIKRGIIPNKITLYMIISGIVGGILFCFPSNLIKFIGMIFMQTWFILDCSDGEVARETKNFSKYGKELDFLAHIINHPIFTFALLISLIQKNEYHLYFLISIFSLNCILDLYNRNLIKLWLIKDLKEGVKETLIQKKGIKKIISIFLQILTVYPNFILFSSIFYFIDIKFIIYYSILNILFTSLLLLKNTLKYLKVIL
ncbi:CDP-alcohol phosphatidyltransferase family protein [Fusobacterium sp. SB021]|uniref:CDP-alcohol phosphatidyltransferase family protein n=1 Tax=Fusobacterium sp. SB021 TaxID=2744227 RepID=UPI003CF100FF